MLLEVAEELAPRAKGLPRCRYSPYCRQEVFSETYTKLLHTRAVAAPSLQDKHIVKTGKQHYIL